MGGDYQDGEGLDATDLFTGRQVVFVLNEYGQLYYVHRFFAVGPDDPSVVPDWKQHGQVLDYGAYVQDSWRVAQGLTINLGLRWDGEKTRNQLGQTVLSLQNWQPRVGVVWDPWGNGATKIYGFVGRFSYAIPTAQAAAAFSNVTLFQTYNFDPVSVVQDPNVIGAPPAGHSTTAGGKPVDTGVKAPYQDELTVGVERLFGRNLTVGLKGTYRRLGGTVEDRCDFVDEEENNFCTFVTPGSSGKFASGNAPTCNGLFDDPAWYQCYWNGPATPTPPARRIYRGVEVMARETLGDRLWLQASYVYSSLRGNYSGGVNELTVQRVSAGTRALITRPFGTTGPGILALDRPHRFRLDGFWTTSWRLSIGLQTFVESGAPVNKLGFFNRSLSLWRSSSFLAVRRGVCQPSGRRISRSDIRSQSAR